MNLQQGTAHCDAQINDFDGPLQFYPTKRGLHPKVRSTLCETFNPPHDISQPTDMRVEKRYDRVKRAKKKSVDEEGLYSDTESLELPSDSSYDSDLASSSD
jgi:hypothetical protein